MLKIFQHKEKRLQTQLDLLKNQDAEGLYSEIDLFG